MFDRLLNTTLPEKVSQENLWLHKRILNSYGFLILLIHTKHKTLGWNFELTPRFYSLKGELTHCIDKAKNVYLKVEQLTIKAGWLDAPLSLRDFSGSNKQNFFFSNPIVTSIVFSDSAQWFVFSTKWFSKNFSNLLFLCIRRFKNS